MMDGLTPEQAYRLQFLGYGNPTSPVWFVGIEEGGVSDEAQPASHVAFQLGEIRGTYDPTLPSMDGRESSVWSIARKLAKEAEAGDGYFLSNMSPFPRPSISVPLQGIDAAAHRQLVREVRIPWLIAILQALRPPAVVFHGKAAWQDYGVLEQLGLLPDHGRVLTYASRGLAFAPFFSRRYGILSTVDMNALTGFLRDALRDRNGSLRRE